MTTPHQSMSDQLSLYALGLLDPVESAAVELALSRDGALAAELQEIMAVTGDLAASAAVMDLPQRVGDRLMSSIGAGRFERFVPRMTTLFDIDAARARQLLASIDQLRSWVPGPLANVDFYHFEGGPGCAGADCGFVRVAAGAIFPWHLHEGEEVSLVLEGSSLDHSGAVLRAGDELRLQGGSAHDFEAIAGENYLYAVRVYGVRFDVSKPDMG
jgi:anti-sigma factor ChrR (cupin superfamily)